MNGLVGGPLLEGGLGPDTLNPALARGAFNSKPAAAGVDRWDRQTDGRSTVAQNPGSTYYSGSAEHACQLSVGYKQTV